MGHWGVSRSLEYADEQSSPVIGYYSSEFILLFVLLQLAPSMSLNQPKLALASNAAESLKEFSFHLHQVSISLMVLPFIFTLQFLNLKYALKKAFPIYIKCIHIINFYTFGRHEHINPRQKKKEKEFSLVDFHIRESKYGCLDEPTRYLPAPLSLQGKQLPIQSAYLMSLGTEFVIAQTYLLILI